MKFCIKPAVKNALFCIKTALNGEEDFGFCVIHAIERSEDAVVKMTI